MDFEIVESHSFDYLVKDTEGKESTDLRAKPCHVLLNCLTNIFVILQILSSPFSGHSLSRAKCFMATRKIMKSCGVSFNENLQATRRVRVSQIKKKCLRKPNLSTVVRHIFAVRQYTDRPRRQSIDTTLELHRSCIVFINICKKCRTPIVT